MKLSTKARLARLSACLPSVGYRSGVIAMRDMETFEEACRRLGVTDGSFLVVREVLPPDQWTAVARLQQSLLTRGDI
jgi:hypothetical protein